MTRPPPSQTRPRRRGIDVAVASFYVLLFFALIWPIYPRFATIEPRVLSLPFSMVYPVAALLISFFVLLAYYLWERKGGLADVDLGPPRTEGSFDADGSDSTGHDD